MEPCRGSKLKSVGEVSPDNILPCLLEESLQGIGHEIPWITKDQATCGVSMLMHRVVISRVVCLGLVELLLWRRLRVWLHHLRVFLLGLLQLYILCRRSSDLVCGRFRGSGAFLSCWFLGS